MATWLKANGEDIKAVQELLRHANPGITMAIYEQAVTPAKRAAQEKVVQSLLPVSMDALEGTAGTVTYVTRN